MLIVIKGPQACMTELHMAIAGSCCTPADEDPGIKAVWRGYYAAIRSSMCLQTRRWQLCMQPAYCAAASAATAHIAHRHALGATLPGCPSRTGNVCSKGRQMSWQSQCRSRRLPGIGSCIVTATTSRVICCTDCLCTPVHICLPDLLRSQRSSEFKLV
jgi:hypothetical protein